MRDPVIDTPQPSSNIKGVIEQVVFVLLLLWYAFFLFHHIDLFPADLGRHIRNGEFILDGLHNSTLLYQILHTNFYSLAYATHPFINHHWGSGVLFFVVWKYAGFAGLHLFFGIIQLLAFGLFYGLAERLSSTKIAAPLAFFIVPLIAERTEIRPEAFSYLGAALFFVILTRYFRNPHRQRLLWLLPVIMLVWINLHIYFIFGFFILGVFFLTELCTSRRWPIIQHLLLVGCATLGAALLNPAGWHGVIYPFIITQQVGLPITENMSIITLENGYHFFYANFLIFKICFALLLATTGYLIFKARPHLPIAATVITIVFGILAWTAGRNLTLFAFFAIPTLSEHVHEIFKTFDVTRLPHIARWQTTGIIALIAFTVGLNINRIPLVFSGLGIDLGPHQTDAAAFITSHHLTGPMFNDFDIGSYAIFYLYPDIHPFVDNRPEAFPSSFFSDIYTPIHNNEATWQKALATYHFNLILYSLTDRSPFALPFVVKRLQDPAWAPVFADDHAIIFLRRTTQNDFIIHNYEIPKSKFSLLTD